MKLLIILIVTICMASATYQPEWKSCSAASDPWQPVEITFDSEPAPYRESEVTLCGTIQEDVVIGGFKLEVKAADMTLYSKVSKLPRQEVSPGSRYCFSHKVRILPVVRAKFYAVFRLHNEDKKDIGCAEVDLKSKITFSY